MLTALPSFVVLASFISTSAMVDDWFPEIGLEAVDDCWYAGRVKEMKSVGSREEYAPGGGKYSRLTAVVVMLDLTGLCIGCYLVICGGVAIRYDHLIR